MNVSLSWAEIAMCAGVGVRRKVESLRKGLDPLHKFAGHAGFEIDIQGACGEYAVAKALNLPWNGSVGSYKNPDVGPYQVRLRVSDHYRGLVLRENDSDDDITILVTGMVPSFEIVGWIKNRNGKKSKYLKRLVTGRPPAFVVPEDKLLPLSKLPSPCEVLDGPGGPP